MEIYRTYVLPRFINLAMQNKVAETERAKFVPLASGKVLEVGIGSGLNIPFYSQDIETLYGLDPSRELWHMARKRSARAPFPIEYIGLSGESVPMEDETVDTVVTTWTLCTIPDPIKALKEMRRVLKRDGLLIFVEHGQSSDNRVQVWQNRLNPLWNRVGGGCNLNRIIDTLISEAGFHITQIETGYIKGLKLFSFLYKGLARPD
jgi:ubiquinone/menaquinone biosynthesis C-methylase UbiE